ncbi:MAG: hypothetical protein JJU13_01700 [Balneolaceae bacterium]|nr:hypothetical protein [Balneolaceae bacterium]
MSATETFVNLSDYPDLESDEFLALPQDEQFRLEDYHVFTQEATSVKPGIRLISSISCEEESEDGDFCGGDIELLRIELPCEVHWNCLSCSQSGKITGFENGPSDLSYLPEETARKYIKDMYGTDLGIDEDKSLDFVDFLDIEGLIDEVMDDGNSFLNWFKDLPPEIKEKFLDDMSVQIDGVVGLLEKETGGLNPAQLYNLLICDWEKNEGPVQLNGKLTAKAIEGSILFHNARTMLLKAQKEDGLGLTKIGNLQRKSVSELMSVCIWPDGYLEAVKRHNKFVNEHDIWLLHCTRVLLEASGLLRKNKGKLMAVKKRSGLSLSSRSGELYRHLFIAYFRKIKISYLSNNIFEYPKVQENIPFALYRLHQLVDDWVSIDELSAQILLSLSYDEIAYRSSIYSKVDSIVYYLLLKPLELFGLIETRNTGEETLWFYQPDQCRKTALFDKFISFRF